MQKVSVLLPTTALASLLGTTQARRPRRRWRSRDPPDRPRSGVQSAQPGRRAQPTTRLSGVSWIGSQPGPSIYIGVRLMLLQNGGVLTTATEKLAKLPQNSGVFTATGPQKF